MSFKIAILRGFGAKPLIRYVSVEAGVMAVRSERSYLEWLDGRGGNQWIGWPKNEPAFEYDNCVFRRLDALYREGASSDLEKEWARCKVLIAK